MKEYKTELRNSLFEKYFEVEDGVLLSNLVDATKSITEAWNFLHKLLEKNVKGYDSWSRLEDIKKIKYNDKEYLIIKVRIHEYIVIDLETKQSLNGNEIFSIIPQKIFVNNFDECEIENEEYNIMYWFVKCNNTTEIINYYNENRKLLDYPTKIFYKINSGDVYTFLSIKLNDGIQLSFQGKDQILYETLFMKSDLTPCGMQDTKDRISIEKMREMFDRVPNIRVPMEYIPKEFIEDGLIKIKENIKLIKK